MVFVSRQDEQVPTRRSLNLLMECKTSCRFALQYQYLDHNNSIEVSVHLVFA